MPKICVGTKALPLWFHILRGQLRRRLTGECRRLVRLVWWNPGLSGKWSGEYRSSLVES
jgi:hypothetical protein